MAEILAIVNQKGGVGKTTTAINLSYGLAMLGKRVLLMDMDAQGNATTGLGVQRGKLDKCIYNVLVQDVPLSDVLLDVTFNGLPQSQDENPKSKIQNSKFSSRLHLIPATVNLCGAEVELVGMEEREKQLKKALEGNVDAYDYVLVDCPPSLGLVTVNALTAAHACLIPIQCEFYAMEALTQLLSTLKRIRSSLNPSIDIKGVLLTMFDARTNLSEQVATEIRYHFPSKVFQTVVPRSVRLSEAPSQGLPIFLYDPNSQGAKTYLELAKEVTGMQATSHIAEISQ